MDTVRISQLLAPFLAAPLAEDQLVRILTYIDILLRWNRKLNLTAVRETEQIVPRHFGESIFAAQKLFAATDPACAMRLVDVGSGAGFPGIPIKLCFPELHVTLIESNNKKATFLREVVRAIALTNTDVFIGRAEDFPPRSTDVVTLRAVERFEHAVAVAAAIVRPRARLALLVGAAQVSRALALVPQFRWNEPLPIPQSSSRVLLIGTSGAEEPSE
jgi:16S rRNA (guanine527-N7)-methyltransferase